MKHASTIFLRVAVLLLGLPVLALCFFATPEILTEWTQTFPGIAYMKYPVVLGMNASAIAFFIALYQALKLLSYIDKNKAFSELSVKALTNIKYCAIVIAVLYTGGMPLIIYMADADDAPGVVAMGMVIIFASIVVAVFAAVLQKLLRNAIDIKSENDLTV